MSRDRQLRVVVGSDQRLVAESVVAGLRGRSYDALVVRWPRTVLPMPKARQRHAAHRTARPLPDAGLVVSDLDRMQQLHGARALVTRLPVAWAVLTGSSSGPVWGGLYEQGVKLVMSSGAGLEEICDVLDELAAGGEPLGQRRRQRDLVQRWRRFSAQRSELTVRLDTLTEREEEVLQQLHDGVAVNRIAEGSDVAVTTVRSQVKAILKKLDVGSQMAAVAAYEAFLTDTTHVDPLGEGMRVEADGGR